MTSASGQYSDFQQVVLERLDKLDVLEKDITDLKDKVQPLDKLDVLEKDITDLKDEVQRSNEKFTNYQQATQWVVQLAFSLIAAATVTVIFSAILGK